MSGFQVNDTMPKLGHVTDLREQWLVRADGVLAHRLQDREISSHLCENRHRNQQIREDFPVALSEQMGIERELRQKEVSRLRQADTDAEIAREMAEINLRRQRRQCSIDILQQPGCSRAPPSALVPDIPSHSFVPDDIDPNALGLTPAELEEMRRRLEQEERDAKLARELSHQGDDRDALLSDMRYAVEAQDGELAKLLQEREYKKLQRAKEKARQKALLKKQQRRATQQQQQQLLTPSTNESQATLLDAYSNPRDLIKQNGLRLSKSVDSDLNYVEPFEKEHIQSKANALQSKEISKQWYMQQMDGLQSNSQNANNMSIRNISNMNNHSFSVGDEIKNLPSSQSIAAMQHRQPPPVPVSIKKPRFPDPVSIRPASHYPTDDSASSCEIAPNSNSYTENNNLYSSTYPPDICNTIVHDHVVDGSKRLSVISDITPENFSKKKKKADLAKKKKGCKIQ